MANFIGVPTSDIANTDWSSSSSNFYTEVDSGQSPSTVDYVQKTSGTGTLKFGLTMPTDLDRFGSVAGRNCYAYFRIGEYAGDDGDYHTLTARIFKSDGVTPLTDAKTNKQSSSGTKNFAFAFTTTAEDAASWENAQLHIDLSDEGEGELYRLYNVFLEMSYLTTAEEVIRPDAIVDESEWTAYGPLDLSKINEDAFGFNIDGDDHDEVLFYAGSSNYIQAPDSPNKEATFSLGAASGEWLEITSAQLVVASRYQNSDIRNFLANLRVGGVWQSETTIHTGENGDGAEWNSATFTGSWMVSDFSDAEFRLKTNTDFAYGTEVESVYVILTGTKGSVPEPTVVSPTPPTIPPVVVSQEDGLGETEDQQDIFTGGGGVIQSTSNASFIKPYLSFVEEATCRLKSEESFVKYDYTSSTSVESSDQCGGAWIATHDRSFTKTPVFFLNVSLSQLDTVENVIISFDITEQSATFQRWNNRDTIPRDSVINNGVAIPKVVLYNKDPRSMIMPNGPASLDTNVNIPPYHKNGIWSEIFRADPSSSSRGAARFASQFPGFFRGGAADLFFYGSLPGTYPQVATRDWENFNRSSQLHTIANYYGGEKTLGEIFDLTYGSHSSAGIPSWIANDVLDYPFITSDKLPITLNNSDHRITQEDVRFIEPYAELFTPVPRTNSLGEITGYTLTISSAAVKRHLIDGSLIKSSADDRAVFGARPDNTLYPEIYNNDISNPGFDDVNQPTYDSTTGEIRHTLAIGLVMTNLTYHKVGGVSSTDSVGDFGATRVINRQPASNKLSTGGITKYPYCAVNNIYTRRESTHSYHQSATVDFLMSAKVSNLTFRINTRSLSGTRYNNSFHKIAVFKYDEEIRPEIQEHINPDFKLTQNTNAFGRSKFSPAAGGISRTSDDALNYSDGQNIDSTYALDYVAQGSSPVVRFGDYSESPAVSGLLPSATDNFDEKKGSYTRGLQVLNTENLFLNDSNNYIDLDDGSNKYNPSVSGAPIGASFFSRNSLLGGFDITYPKINNANKGPDFVPLYIKSYKVSTKKATLISKGSVMASGEFSLVASGNTQAHDGMTLKVGQSLGGTKIPLYIKPQNVENFTSLNIKMTPPQVRIPLITKAPKTKGEVPLTFAKSPTGVIPLYGVGPIASGGQATLHVRSSSYDANRMSLVNDGVGGSNNNIAFFASGVAHSNAQIPLTFAPETASNTPLYLKSSISASGLISLRTRARGPYSSGTTLTMDSIFADVLRDGTQEFSIGSEGSTSLFVNTETPTSRFATLNTQGVLKTINSNQQCYTLQNSTNLFDLGDTENIGKEAVVTKDSGSTVSNTNSIIYRGSNTYTDNLLRFQDHGFNAMAVQRKEPTSVVPPNSINEIVTYDPVANAVQTATVTTNSNSAFYEDAANDFAWQSTKVLNRAAYDANGTYLVNGSIKGNNVELAIYDINDDDTVSHNNVLRFNPTLLSSINLENDPLFSLRSDLYERVISNSSREFTVSSIDSSNIHTSIAIYDLRLSDNNRCAVSIRVDLTYRLGIDYELHKFDIIIVCNLNNFGKTLGPFPSNGYYPLYRTPEAAIANSPDPGSVRAELGEITAGYHIHTFDGVDYYMPNGLVVGATQFHGNYTGYSDPDRLEFESANDYNWLIFDKGSVVNPDQTPNSQLSHETLSAGLNIQFDNEDLYFDKRQYNDQIWRLSTSDDYTTPTQVLSFADTPDHSSYLSNSSFITTDRLRTGFGYPFKIYDRDGSGDKLMVVSANYVDPYIRNTLTDAYIPNAIGALYMFTRVAGTDDWSYHGALYGKGYTSDNVVANLSAYNNGTGRKEIRLFGYSFDYNNGYLAVTEPGGTGSSVDEFNFANVDTGKAYLFDVSASPVLIRTYNGSSISLPLSTISSTPNAVSTKGENIGPYSNFGSNIILSNRTEPVTWSDGSISQTTYQGQHNDQNQFVDGATLFADDSTIYNLKTGQVFGFDLKDQGHDLDNLKSEIRPYMNTHPVADIRTKPDTQTSYSSRILHMRKLKFATGDRIGVVRMFEARPTLSPYTYSGAVYYDDIVTVQKLSIVDFSLDPNNEYGVPPNPLFIKGPFEYESPGIALHTPGPVTGSGNLTLRIINGTGSPVSHASGITLTIGPDVHHSFFELRTEGSPAVNIPLYMKVNDNVKFTDSTQLYIKNVNTGNNLDLHLGVPFKEVATNTTAYIKSVSQAFASGAVGTTTLFMGEENIYTTDLPLFLNNDRLNTPYGWADQGVDSPLSEGVSYPSGLLTIPLNIGGLAGSGADALGPLFMLGNVVESGIAQRTLYISTVIPPTGISGGYVHSGDITLSLQGNNNASTFFNYNTLEPGPSPGLSLVMKTEAVGSGLTPLYINKAFGGISDFYVEGESPASGLSTLMTHCANKDNVNTTLKIQAPTTETIPKFIRGFRE